jgi:Secretion system C-terminal sorting domain
MKQERIAFLVALIFTIGFSKIMFGQNKLSRSVIAGGSVAVSGENHRVLGTIGQPLNGSSGNISYRTQVGFWYNSISSTTDVEQTEDLIPKEFQLEQNYPNPFNPSTKIKFGLPKESKVLLLIYNILGEEVAQLVNQQFQAGYYEIELYNSGFSSGVYLYTIQAGDFVDTKKMILLK